MDFIRRWVGQTDRLAVISRYGCIAGEGVWQNPSPLQACRVIVGARQTCLFAAPSGLRRVAARLRHATGQGFPVPTHGSSGDSRT